MKLIFLVAVIAPLTFALSAAADDVKTQEPTNQETTQTKTAPASHINATLYDGNDSDGGGDDAATAGTSQTDGGQKVAPTRAPTGSSGDLPYSDDEMRQADPNNFSPSNKNMPVDQD